MTLENNKCDGWSMREIRYENAGSRERQDTGSEELEIIAKYRMGLVNIQYLDVYKTKHIFSQQNRSWFTEIYTAAQGHVLRQFYGCHGNRISPWLMRQQITSSL